MRAGTLETNDFNVHMMVQIVGDAVKLAPAAEFCYLANKPSVIRIVPFRRSYLDKRLISFTSSSDGGKND